MSDAKIALSEGCTVLTHVLTTVGQRIHRAEESGFVALYTKLTSYDGQVTHMDQENPCIRIQVGVNMNTFLCRVDDMKVAFLEHVHVKQGEEIWAATNCPTKLIVYGVVALQPQHTP